MGREQQVHVVRHEDVSMDRARIARGKLAQMMQVTAVVVIGEEANAAVIPTLDDMQRGTGDSQTSAAGHDWRVESSMDPLTQLPPSGLQTVVCPRFTRFTGLDLPRELRSLAD